jgi:pteridine reductase
MKTVLVTGSARRVGAEIVKSLHKQGFVVIIHFFHSEKDAKDLIKQLNGIRKNSAFGLKANLSKLADIKQLAQDVLKISPKLDVLVNNASSFFPTEIGQTTEQQWQDLMSSNLFAPFFLSQELAPNITNCIINIIDIHAFKPLKNYSVYSSAKAGLRMLTLSLAKELAPNIRVNGIAPGAIMWPEENAELSNNFKENILQKIPLAKQGMPEDIANSVIFLTQADYITGQIIKVDGGRSLTQ